MTGQEAVLLVDLLGTFAFALNGALTAARAVHLDITGVVVLGIITAIGGGMLRDVLIGDIPPAAFRLWYYLPVAFAGALLAFWISRPPRLLTHAIEVLDAIGLSLFCVVGALKALSAGLDPAPAIILGTVTAVGGGTIRDVAIRRVPSVLTGGLYAIPAVVGATIAVVAQPFGALAGPAAVTGAAACFVIRMLGLRFDWHPPAAAPPVHDT